MKPHIKLILKKGANLKAIKLDQNDQKVKELIEKTCKEQEKIISSKKFDYKILETYITI